MSTFENERRIIAKPFPISDRAWEIAASELLSVRDDKIVQSLDHERGILKKHYPNIHFLITNLSGRISENVKVDTVYYTAGLFVGFRMHRAEAEIRGGVLPEVPTESLIQFLAHDINLSKDLALNEQQKIRKLQEELFDRFKLQEPQAWRGLQRKRFASNEMKDGMYFGISNMNALIRK
ncbi:MAG: hypothetical protein KBC00_01505 [Candidatus Levybacteria bacterium]|nr:hypothetical protein [Candidatus Levybacteria bacterium]MBP9814802.1 hypothetical protein [Candidatus Levybacteria bacterium]